VVAFEHQLNAAGMPAQLLASTAANLAATGRLVVGTPAAATVAQAAAWLEAVGAAGEWGTPP
jgi:hypothetical protein